ncbi:MAG: restriction endonuclease subunit S [Gammaproteobacteria bacterium]|nr:restriction endonuclease subunit S [Gammaproteobacteria bacterium]
MLDDKKNKGEPLPYLANINVRWGDFDLENLREMRFEHDEIDRYGLKYGDIVMCEGGEPGRCAIWKESVPGMMIQKAIHRIRPHACIDHRFLFYSFLHKGRSGAFAPLFTGATIKHLPREKLAKVAIEFPSIAVQGRIADILSAYDDLIENNRRRMALLEDAARQLYREWFVRLRFPGHEHTRIQNGLPDGWEAKSFTDLADFVNGYPFSPDELGDTGFPIVKIPELRSGISDKTPRNTGESIPEKYFLADGDLLFSWSGTLLIEFWYDGPALVNQHLFRVESRAQCSAAFLLFALQEALPEFAGQSVGATMKHIRKGALKTVTTIVPPAALLHQFSSFSAEVFESILNLRRQNQRLRAARDLLLPRLLSGEVVV